MKVLKRVVIKLIIFLFVVAVAGGGAACWQGYRQSTPEYTIERYLSLLIDNNGEKAYEMLDQSEDGKLTLDEYESALEAGKYSLYASYKKSGVEIRRDNNGSEFVDYHAEFLNAADEVQMEMDFTVKKQAEATLGIFDKWKVLSGHCMVKDFVLTVPTGSEVYINNVKADTSWIERDGVLPSYDSYRIPSLIPGKSALVVRHPALESVNATLDPFGKSDDYTDKMALKESAKSECKELGIKALKQLYSSAASGKNDDLKVLFADCKKQAEKFVKDQGSKFSREEAVFKNIAVSKFAAQFGDLTFTKEENGAITTEMTFSYHYVVREDVTADTGETAEDGTPIQQTETKSHSGDAKAKLLMSFYDGAWHIASIEIPVVPS